MTPAGAAAAETLARLERQLLDARAPAGHWVGELSSSALATATAVGALALARGAGHEGREGLIDAGRRWLVAHANADGGWGDTTASASNVATTALVLGAPALAGADGEGTRAAEARAETWLRRRAGGTDAASLARALGDRYGHDRTFSAPILTFLALSGQLGDEAWRYVAPLPFELAMVPARWLGALRVPVVSYALPTIPSWSGALGSWPAPRGPTGAGRSTPTSPAG